MLFKLSLKNIKKSLKDYSIYFFTLVFAVSIFYIFNSLDAQESMFVVSKSKYQIVQMMVTILGYISIFISIILGFLIIYSNNFLIKRRKKEFGLYLTLGMSKKKVSMILVIETLTVGLLSLGIGLLLGIFLSQFLSVLTAKLFEVNMESWTFIFSSNALLKTILYFSIIFIFVMIFNLIIISKYKLIDLLMAGRKNEKIRFRNKYVTLITFILAITFLTYAYYKLFNGALVMMDNSMLYMIIAGSLGTFLLFYSASGFLLKVFEKIKNVYYKNLNMFVLKQINNKINTNVLSTTIICLMLLLTIGILSGSMSLISVYNNDIKSNNITDFTINEFVSVCSVSSEGGCVVTNNNPTLKEIIKEDYFNKTVKEYVYYELYIDKNLTMDKLVDEDSMIRAKKEYGNALNMEIPLNIMTESDYNEIMSLYGYDKIDLNDKEYLLTANIETAIDFLKNLYESGNNIIFNNYNLKPSSKKIVEIGFSNYSTASNFGTIILDDKVVSNLDLLNVSIIGNYVDKNITETEEDLFFDKVYEKSNTYSDITKRRMQNNGISIKVMVTFIGLYLGIIFAISSATVLAIGQLSSSSDNKERYKILRQIGANDKMIKKALLTQIAISFGFPLVVAIIHAFFGLKELTKLISIFGSIDITVNVILTSLFIIVVYGGYFVATYICSKGIIKEN